ncbi:MAG: VanZ family protein [Oscillospiraceae bacterium]|nr:VanZ family protein [Oscillospiraceae bacterium]
MIKKRILQISVFGMMILIFYFSAQPADDSTETSSRFCILLARMLYPDYDLYDWSIREIITDGLTFIVRKAAHFTEYAVLGCLFYFNLNYKKSGFLLAVLLTGLYACTDEFHQLFVSGRSGQLRDVAIDTCGGLCGAITGFIILCIWYYFWNHKK